MSKPGSPNYGKVISSVSVDGRNEAHHGGFTDDRRQLWLAGLDTSKIFIFDVHTDPAKPRYVKTIDNFAEDHRRRRRTAWRVCVARTRAHSVSLEREGQRRTHRAGRIRQRRQLHRDPLAADEGGRVGAAGAEFADGYGYDARVLPRKNALLTSSFTGLKNYMTEFGKVVADPEAMKHFGETMVMWDFHTRQPKKVFQVPGAPLEIRWAWGDKHNYAFTATALTSKLWLVYADDKGEWQAKEVATDRRRQRRRPAGRHQPERR